MSRPLTRLPHWPLYLDHAVEAARAKPFAWTRDNCATFAADCVAAVTGVRLHGKFAGLMTSPRRAILHAESLVDHVDAILGATTRIEPAHAQRGDVVLVPTSAGPALAVCVGAKAAAKGPEGVTLTPMTEALCAWRI